MVAVQYLFGQVVAKVLKSFVVSGLPKVIASCKSRSPQIAVQYLSVPKTVALWP